MDGSDRPEARWEVGVAGRLGALSGLLVVAAVLWMGVRHLDSRMIAVFFAWLVTALLVSAQVVLSVRARPYAVDPTESAELDRLRVVVLVPCYNEDPGLLERSLRSMVEQTRPPDAISVVDDGSQRDYACVQHTISNLADTHDIVVHWRRTKNHGKRYALINAARQEPDADIYMTVDSDSILDRAAIGEGLKPFADPRVQSVAGFLLVLNYSESLLSRMMELVIVSWGQFERSALSFTGSVLVNSGACAFYRSEVVRERAADFLSETIMGRPMSFSDDSLLTLFALEKGRAVQQPTAFAFSRMPTDLHAHLVQQARWMRGAIVRAWWRFKYLSLGSVAYWVLVLKWFQFIANTVLSVVLVVALLTVSAGAALLFCVGWLAVQYAISSRYLTLRRSDQSRRQRWGVFALVPVVVLWQMVVLHHLRLYAYATFARTGWGGRTT